MVRTADERTGFHMQKPQSSGYIAKFVELLRIVIALDGQVFWRGTQVLANGKQVTPMGAKVGQGLYQFFLGFAQTHHDSRFCSHRRGIVFDSLKKLERL